MLGKVALGVLIFVSLTILFIAMGERRSGIGVFLFLVLLAYVAVSAVYFLTMAGYV